MIFGFPLELPLVKRELVVEVLRTKRAFFLVLIALVFSIGMTLLAWPRHLGPAGMGMENVFSVVLFLETQLTAAILIIPAFTAGAIAGERERGTYELLHATLLSPRAIVLSKALASTGFVFILLAAAAPVACALYLVGGVAFQSFLQGYAVTLASVVLSGLICLHASMRSGRTAGAVVRGVAGIIFWNGGLFFLGFLITAALHAGRSGSPSWFPFLFNLSPHAATAATILGFGAFSRTSLPVEPWLGSVLYSTALSTFYLALVLLPSRLRETVESRGGTAGKRTLRARLKRRSLPTRLLLAIGEKGAPWNPVFLKEIRSEFFGRTIYRSLAFWGSLVLFIWIAALNSLWEPALYTVFTVAMVLTILVAPAVSASAFPREIEQGNIDFLRSTLLGLRSVLWGKLLAAIYSVSGIVLAAVLACSPAFFRLPGTSLHALGVLATALLATISISLLASALSRKTLTALVGAYGLLLVWLAGWPIFLVFASMGGAGRDLFDWLMVTSPFGAMYALETPPFEDPFAKILVFHALHLGASVFLLVLAGSYLETSRSRDP